ncbi:ATP-dependent DNA helicase PIF1-like [Cydia splendana]|uniref:ATP-dependent DNA helicase PIF1-like n=1 Tax=Cydia splendana TaxID=1100963 RepID=UPI00300D5203
MSDDFFGGMNILLFGDLMQLPPVSKSAGGAYCFNQPQNLESEVNLWAIFSFCELPQNMRQADDTSFVDILNSLRVGQLTMQQLEVLDRRRVPLVGQFADGECVRIFPTAQQVNDYNNMMTNKLAQSCLMYDIVAVDVSLEAKRYGETPKAEFISTDPNKTGGFPKALKIAVGSRVMLRKNINVGHGLVNGAMGVIKKIEWPALRRDQLEPGELPQAVFIEFDDKSKYILWVWG